MNAALKSFRKMHKKCQSYVDVRGVFFLNLHVDLLSLHISTPDGTCYIKGFSLKIVCMSKNANKAMISPVGLVSF